MVRKKVSKDKVYVLEIASSFAHTKFKVLQISLPLICQGWKEQFLMSKTF